MEQVDVGSFYQLRFHTVPLGSVRYLVDISLLWCDQPRGSPSFLNSNAVVEESVTEDHGHGGGDERILEETRHHAFQQVF